VSEDDVEATGSRKEPTHLITLSIIAVLSTCLYGTIALLSWQFDFDSPTQQRPIVPVLLLFGAAFVAYLFAIRVATQAKQDRRLLGLIIWSAVVFRLVFLFSVPIQEIDIYRYLWDGAVSTTGVSPFQYSPKQVRVAAGSSTSDEDLRSIMKLLDREPAMVEILRRIHFGELPTIYPPVSQVVFAAAAFTTPANSSLATHVFIMKTWLVGFDLATLALVIGLLRLCRKPVGLCLIYAWCPLLLKEVANSGHLDAIAVFLTTLAIYLAARLLVKLGQSSTVSLSKMMYGSVVAIVLALAIGAKLFPVVLAPLMLFVFVKRIGWTKSLIPAAAFVAMTLFVVWPLLPRNSAASSGSPDVATSNTPALALPPPTANSSSLNSDPSLGVTTFLRRWEMNDFIFLVLIENLKPDSQLTPERTAWFSVIPDGVRQRLVASVVALVNIPEPDIPFLSTRAITATVFLVLAGWFGWRAAQTTDVAMFCEAGFLTLAWFWLLCPTQNPWYWTWALPLLPFARSRVWLAVSGLTLLYYLRFWLSYHWPEASVLGTGYSGTTFFDFIVTWIEFAPWFVWLGGEAYMRRSHTSSDVADAEKRDQTRSHDSLSLGK
jgi:hypothetical protein